MPFPLPALGGMIIMEREVSGMNWHRFPGSRNVQQMSVRSQSIPTALTNVESLSIHTNVFVRSESLAGMPRSSEPAALHLAAFELEPGPESAANRAKCCRSPSP
ncbi:hypothetical protein CDAR_380091 [Caerostris darwini]|uniref:Uncharacterized protein n=1 Tax=Caerostris darwini TaxID=1538125 RepID=A0AAV4WBW1_9ARAC|nr:hypothetical protein CDAR_380091 [Caerostris darwini]